MSNDTSLGGMYNWDISRTSNVCPSCLHCCSIAITWCNVHESKEHRHRTSLMIEILEKGDTKECDWCRHLHVWGHIQRVAQICIYETSSILYVVVLPCCPWLLGWIHVLILMVLMILLISLIQNALCYILFDNISRVCACLIISPYCRIYVSLSWNNFGSGNGYSMPHHYRNQCWFIVNWTLRNRFQSNIFIQVNAFQNVKWRPFCPGGTIRTLILCIFPVDVSSGKCHMMR